MKTIKIVDALSNEAIIGRHSIWLPKAQLKFPFQWNGKITKYQHNEKLYDVGDTFPHEIAIMRALAEIGMAPPIGDVVFAENLITSHSGGWHCDPCGAYGYEIADANALPKGKFNIDAMRRLPITGSEGAWGDILKPGNVINGYLVDVRRSAFDMLKWNGPSVNYSPIPPENTDKLAADVHKLCQFPKGERKEAYQDFWLENRWHTAERRVVERATLLGFAPKPGETVLEIGCQSGGFLQLAHNFGARDILGVEIDPDYVDCARRLARQSGQNICVRQMDAVKDRPALVNWIRERFPQGLTHLLLLSMEKHMGHDNLFALVDKLQAKRTYIETNAVAVDNGNGSVPHGNMKLWPEVQTRGGAHIGNSRDRNLRRLYRIDR